MARGHAEVIAFLETLAKAEDASGSLEREHALRVMASALLQMNVKNCTFTPLVAREEALLKFSLPPRQLLPGQDWCKVHMRSCP